MPGSWITDLRHFLDDVGLPVGGPPGRRAAYWRQLVEAATVRPDGARDGSAVGCRRSPRRVRCTGCGIADVLDLTPAMRERHADVLGRAADDAILELDFRRCIEALLDGTPVPTGRQLQLALDLGELVDRIRATGAARPEVTCAAAGHLLGRLRAAADTLSDSPALRAACTQLGETAVALARRTRPDRSRLVLEALLDAYLDAHLSHLDSVPAALRHARFGKRLRRWLAAETAARSDTAEPARAVRCAAIAAAVVVDGA